MKQNGKYLEATGVGYLKEITAPKERAAILAKDYRNYSNLSECYGSYSWKKASAFDYCRRLCYALGGFNLRIVSYNTFFFSVKFEFAHPDTGVLCTAYITPSYNKFTEC